MRISRLRVANFRNIEFADLPFSGTRIFLLGKNGQGKTNLLEAASLLTALRSFRTRDTRLLVRNGEKLAQASFEIAHEIEGETRIVLGLASSGAKTIETGSGTPVKRLGEFVGRFPAVVFSSDDIALVRGSPTIRRRWADVTFSAAIPGYLAHLQRYYRALESRNRLLKSSENVPEQCAAFEKIMAESGDFLARSRKIGFADAAEEFATFAGRILKIDVPAQIIYSPSAELENTTAWEEFFERARRTDSIFRATQKGPHRDDFRFRIGGKDAADFASEGQQRGMALALGLAQLAFFRKRTGIAPVVLADDVLGELDPERRENFWREVGAELQVVATGTQLPANAGEWEVFHVSAGAYSRERAHADEAQNTLTK